MDAVVFLFLSTFGTRLVRAFVSRHVNVHELFRALADAGHLKHFKNERRRAGRSSMATPISSERADS